ncbi:MAG: tetratricopeptide repeat protein [Anaerolineae bacterium]|jgi:tetratricopeptide (TPR) repeat protein
MVGDRQDGATIKPGGVSHLDEGIGLARQGDHAGARTIFRRIIHQNPHNEDAWLWLAWVAESRQESLRLLEEARLLAPDSERIAEGIAWAREQLGITVERKDISVAPAPTRRSRRRKESALRVRQKKVRREKPAPAPSPALRQSGANSPETPARSYADDLPATRVGGRRLVTILASVAAVAVVLLLGMMIITHAQSEPRIVQALDLPPMVEATPTLSAEQRARSLWQQVDVAFTRGDWNTAVDLLNHIRQIDPRSDEARARLAEAHFNRGMRLIESNQLDEAREEFDMAVRLNAGSQKLQQVRRELHTYMKGLEAYWEKDWPKAVEQLQLIYESDPDFRDTQMMLAQAYLQWGISYQDARVWDDAKKSYEMALEISPDLDEAQSRLAQVIEEITPPRRIEVNLTTRIVEVYENNEVVRTYLSCTGRSTAPTVPGRYEIQSKMPMAYGSQWDLNMPWWLGIYWAGGSENGFHALPILSNGTVLWRGYLGQGCSFGCIVLDTEDAKELYDWAEIGTVVIISP